MASVIEVKKSDNSRQIFKNHIRINYLNDKKGEISEFLEFTDKNGFKVDKIDMPSRDERNER